MPSLLIAQSATPFSRFVCAAFCTDETNTSSLMPLPSMSAMAGAVLVMCACRSTASLGDQPCFASA